MQQRNLPVWMVTNAWREIFGRIFEGFRVKHGVSPEWLVNPVTNRRLKLDMLYSDINVAVRFEGLQGKQRRQRPSLEEEAQMRIRTDARTEVCRQHGVELVLVQIDTGKPEDIFQQIDAALSRANRSVEDPVVKQKLRDTRAEAAALARKIRHIGDLKLYAELWEDRQYQVLESAPSSSIDRNDVTFVEGMEVEHVKFGPGVVVTVTPTGDDVLLTVDFISAGQRTLAASLVVDKLVPK